MTNYITKAWMTEHTMAERIRASSAGPVCERCRVKEEANVWRRSYCSAT